MSITNSLASLAVNELRPAQAWFAKLLGRAPDLAMPEIAEWKFGGGGGLQVYALPERAGHGSVTLEVSDLDDQIAALRALGIDPGKPIVTSKTRVVMIKDPDGNSIAFAQPLAPDPTR